MPCRKKLAAVSIVGFAVLLLTGCVNRPPQIDCISARTTVVEGGSLTLKAETGDPNRGDRDKLTLSWSSTGGKVTEGDSVATFDATGVNPGSYKVTAEVSDRKLTASCDFDITVQKNKKKPTISCNPGSVSITEGKSKTLRASARDANNDSLTYSWKVDGKSVSSSTSSLEFGTTGRSVGSHQAIATVKDTDGMTASCTFNVTIERRPNTNPNVSLRVDKAEALMGETVRATATATDAEGDPISYGWAVNGRSQSGSGASFSVNTSGMGGGAHSVSVTASDDQGGKGTATASFKVREKIVIHVNGRLNNVAKAKLDEIALKLQQNPSLRATITGHTDGRGSEKGNMKAGMKRAGNAKGYLIKQHSIGEARIATKSAGESSPIADNKTAQGRKENRRAVVELYVP